MRRISTTAVALGLALSLAPVAASAQRVVIRTGEAERTEVEELERTNLIGPALVTNFGGLLQVGGGVRNFTEPGVTDVTSAGGYWDVRGVIGTRSFLGLEAAYHGSASDVDAIGLSESAFLVSNGVEGAIRVNAPITQTYINFASPDVPVLIEPYAVGGIGWQRYNLVNEGVNTSLVESADDVMTVPLGVGLTFGLSGLALDARFMYRQALFSSLVGTPTSSFGDESLNSWSFGAGLGFEF